MRPPEFCVGCVVYIVINSFYGSLSCKVRRYFLKGSRMLETQVEDCDEYLLVCSYLIRGLGVRFTIQKLDRDN